MKTLSKLLFSITLIGLFSIAACKKDNTETSVPSNNNTSTLDAKVETIKVNDTLAFSYEYNTSGKLSKTFEYSQHGILRATSTYQYADSTIIEYVLRSDNSNYTKTYYIGSNGYIYKNIKLNAGYTTFYTQDINGYLIKYEAGDYSENHAVENGNLIKYIGVQFQGGPQSESDTTFYAYEYFYDKLLPGPYFSDYGTIGQIPIGKPNKNLVKTMSKKNKNGTSTIENTYTFENNLIIKNAQKLNGVLRTITYTYKK